MDGECSTNSTGFDPDESHTADTAGVQHVGQCGRQKSLADLSSSKLTYRPLPPSEDANDVDGDAKELVTVGDEEDMHMMSVRRIDDDVDSDPLQQFKEAERVNRMIRDTVESVLDGHGTIALRVNDHVLDRRGQVDPAMTATLKDKISTSAVILMNQERHDHRWRCCVM